MGNYEHGYDDGYEKAWEQSKDYYYPKRDEEIKLIIKELKLRNRDDKKITQILDKLISRIEGKENKVQVTVYTKEVCPQCDMTKKQLDRYGIRYEEVPLESVPDKLEEFKAQGYLAAPIVTTDVKIWSGFRLEKIKSLANHLFGENK